MKAIKRQLEKFDCTFHDFRRTFGTRWSKLLKSFELNKIMRHRDLSTTDKYYVHNEIDEIRSKMNGSDLVVKKTKRVKNCTKLVIQNIKKLKVINKKSPEILFF